MTISNEKIIVYHPIKRGKAILNPMDSLTPKMKEDDKQWKRNTRVRLSSNSFVVASVILIEDAFAIDKYLLYSPIVTKLSVKRTLIFALVVSALLNQFLYCHNSEFPAPKSTN